MGYSEVLCHICGVSFNIGRVRTRYEPRRAAWQPELPPGESFPEGNGDCPPDAGCSVVRRKRPDTRDHRISSGEPTEQDMPNSNLDDDDTSSFAPTEDSLEEPLEWNSDAASEMDIDSLTGESDGYALGEYDQFRNLVRDQSLNGISLASDPDQNDKFESLHIKVDAETVRNAPKNLVPYHPRDGARNPQIPDCYRNVLWRYEDSTSYDGPREYMLEHVAGPGCRLQAGYNGNNLTSEEMEMCQTLQCLVRKNGNNTGMPDDEEFERQGEFFLSGLSDHMPSRDVGSPHVYPARRNVESPYAENSFWEPSMAETYAMPFHPYCLEIYKHASELDTEAVDIEGLTSWWSLEANYEAFKEFPRHPAVKQGEEQMWQHNSRDEFLVANPLYIPKLPTMLESAARVDRDFDVRSSPFLDNELQASVRADCFTSFPEEIRSDLLSYLGSKDIANLRLASTSFYQLPKSLWYDLIRKEMPWLWEAWSDMPYSFWTRYTAEKLRKKEASMEESEREVREYFDVLNEEMPEMREQNDEARQRCLDEISHERAAARKPLQCVRLEWCTTDWHHLYVRIKRHWKDLKGLQNRERIWTDCEEILKRVGKYREQGLIPVQDVRAIAEAN